MTGKITVNQIKDRQQFLNGSNDGIDLSNLYEIAIDSIKNNKQTVREDAQSFFNACECKVNANSYIGKCLDILESVKKDNYLSSILENNLCSKIIPYIKDVEMTRTMVFNRKLYESSVKNINEALDKCHICDRIISNNDKLSKRFNFDKYIKENAYKPIDDIVLKCCEMIDTYDMPSYAKTNIAIEELSYMLQKNFVKYDGSRMVQLITEYFINYIDNAEEIENIKKSITENYCLDDNDLIKIKYFLEDFATSDKVTSDYNPYDMGTDKIVCDQLNVCVARFNQFKVNPNKNIEDFKTVLEKNIDELPVYQIQSLSDIFDWVRNFGLNIFDNTLCDCIKKYLNKLVEIIGTNTKQLDSLETILNLEIAKKSDNETQLDKNFYDIISKVSEDIDISKSTMATLSEQTFEANRKSSDRVMSLDEFKIFKFDNIIKYAWLTNKKLKEKEKTFAGKIKGKLSKIFNSAKEWLKEDYIISESSKENIIDCISSLNNFDHILAIYEVENIEDIDQMNIMLSEFCSDIQSSSPDPEIRVYYTNIDNLFEIHIADTSWINLTEKELEEQANSFTEAEQAYCGYLMSLIESMDRYDSIETGSLAEDFKKIESTLTAEGVVGIIEASKYLVNLVPLGRLEEIAELYAINHPMDYMGNTAISQALDFWKLEECDLDMVVDTVTMLRECVDEALLTEADKEPSKAKQALDNAKENVKKIEKTKINFNTLRYAMESLKTKANNAGDKAKQFTNTLNIYVEKFITSVQKLYTNDSREQIIRGSIIPSFHQLMGRLLVIGGSAGVGGVVAGSTAAKAAGVAFGFSATGAIFAAAVTTFATIAISKHSTDKERALMLDEIEIEIDICEKEMSRAEANGQMKKYRALMYRRAKLKREYQRIRYNIGYKEFKHNSVVRSNND